MTDEVHTSMTGLESCFEEELARADRHYVDPNQLNTGERGEGDTSMESMESDPVEEAMRLDT